MAVSNVKPVELTLAECEGWGLRLVHPGDRIVAAIVAHVSMVLCEGWDELSDEDQAEIVTLWRNTARAELAGVE